MTHQDCRHELLAQDSLGHVTVCPGCGQIHLTLQYMTVRLEPGAFRALRDMVDRAQRSMDERTITPARAVPAGAAGSFH